MRQGILASTFAVACGFAVLTAPGAHAAMLTFGRGTTTAGGFGCADVNGGNITPGTPVSAFDCHGAPNQQCEINGRTIFALGAQRCLDVFYNNQVPGTKIDSATCNGTNAQVWYYYNGEIKNFSSNLCLDAGNGANGTQLIINTCNGSSNQQWQIK
jgi:cytochrome c